MHFRKRCDMMLKIKYFWLKFAEEATAAEGVTLSGFPQGKGTANGHNFGESHLIECRRGKAKR